MIDTWLLFFILFISIVLAVGAYLRSPIVIAFSGVMFISLGLVILYGDAGITTDKVSGITTIADGNSTAATLSYLTLTPSNDVLVNALGLIFFYGGWLPVAIGAAILFGRMGQPKQQVGELG